MSVLRAHMHSTLRYIFVFLLLVGAFLELILLFDSETLQRFTMRNYEKKFSFNLLFHSKIGSTLKAKPEISKLDLDLADAYISLFRADTLCKTVDISKKRLEQTRRPMKSLIEYAKWHEKEREKLLSKDPKEIKDLRTLIWHFKEYSQSAGLADKVRGTTVALILAILSERLLFIQWSSQPFRTSRQRNIFKPNQINWDIDEEILTLIGKNATIDNPDLTATLHGKYNASKNPNIMQNIFSCEDRYHHLFFETTIPIQGILSILRAHNDLKMRKCFRHPELTHKTDVMNWTLTTEAFHLISGQFSRYLFKFSEKALTRASHELINIGMRIDQNYSVVHIRTGFYGLYNEKDTFTRWSKFNLTSEETWRGLVNRTIAKSAKSIGPSAPVLVLTDSDLVKEWVRREYKGSVKVTEGTVGHIGHGKELKMTNKVEEIEYQTGAELSIMAHSHLLTTSVGGFSQLASSMCLMATLSI